MSLLPSKAHTTQIINVNTKQLKELLLCRSCSRLATVQHGCFRTVTNECVVGGRDKVLGQTGRIGLNRRDLRLRSGTVGRGTKRRHQMDTPTPIAINYTFQPEMSVSVQVINKFSQKTASMFEQLGQKSLVQLTTDGRLLSKCSFRAILNSVTFRIILMAGTSNSDQSLGNRNNG